MDPADAALWAAIEKTGRQSDYEVYLTQYPNGVFAALARRRIAELKSADSRPTQAPQVLQLAGTEWTGTFQDLDRKNRVVSESPVSLSFQENGQGRALYWDGSHKFKWEKIGPEIVIKIDGFAGWNPHLRGKIVGDKMEGTWSDPLGDNSRWFATLVSPRRQ